MNLTFDLSNEISINAHLKVAASLVVEKLGPLLTDARKSKIEQVLPHRNFSNAVVLEGIYDRGNISAVMRSAEAMGFVNFHVIETQEKFKESARVTQGADKWVELKKWKNTSDAVKLLKANGHKIIVTHLESSKPLHQIDFSQPTALVLGNEKSGVSQEMLDLSDERVIIPMSGFVQSYNISVAGALCFYHIAEWRRQKSCGQDLSAEQLEVLRALYYLRTQDSGYKILEQIFSKHQYSV